ncbi:hypothetical protein, partial [Komagataeibacter swingsii]|uniref:hypothetical protein n=1 Tax=Komagataeibacter swingsii TaxID=215220 RepID=UPI001C3FF729
GHSLLSHTTVKEWRGFRQHKPGQPWRYQPQNAQPDRLLEQTIARPGKNDVPNRCETQAIKAVRASNLCREINPNADGSGGRI